MANATIQSLTETQTGNFGLEVSFGESVGGFDKTDVDLRALTENGITGIDYTISGNQPGTNFILMFTVPDARKGSFELSITGTVTPESGSSPEGVMANSVVIVYDTIAYITATFGTHEDRDDGTIVVPVTFAEDVIIVPKTIFNLTGVGEVDVSDAYFRINGEGKAYYITIEIRGKAGEFILSGAGNVLKADQITYAPIKMADKRIPFNNIEPEITETRVSGSVKETQVLNILVAFNTEITGWHQNNTIGVPDRLAPGIPDGVFQFRGANLGTPSPYKWIDDDPPNLDTAVPAAADELKDIDELNQLLLSHHWQLLAAPPEGTPTPGSNGFDAYGGWHGESGQYFLIRFGERHDPWRL